MCGRYTYKFSWTQLHRLLKLVSWPDTELTPRYNIAPTQVAPIVRLDVSGQRQGAMLRWGLIPTWADSPAIGNRHINARAETVATSPSFRAAFAQRRCLVPVSGFYEWRKGEGDLPKQPFWIGRVDREPFTFAGVWESWTREGETIESYTIITTTPNALLAPVHNRMPVIVAPEDYGRWLGEAPTSHTTTDAALALLHPAAVDGFESFPVSTRVNSPRNDDPTLEQRVNPTSQGLFGQ
jgi:putative SOS response-associated peptidase YedK